MNWFRVLLRGENFRMKLRFVGPLKIYGFWTTRFVEAETLEAAGQAAITLIREDDYLKSRIRNPEGDPPMIYTDEIEPVVPRQPGDHGEGYTFYSDDA